MRLWILSDLHLEVTRGWDLPAGDVRPQLDVLVIAGDLIPRAERGVKWLLERLPDRPVIFVPGNHEAYGADVDRTVEKAMDAAAGTKIFMLQNRWIRLSDVTFAGATLWTDFELFGDRCRAITVAAEQMNDFRKIRINRYVRRFQPRHALARHLQAHAFLEAMRNASGPPVVVTHHAPIPSRAYRLGRHYLGSRLSDQEVLTAAYRSNLTSLMWPAPIADGKNALFGHMHESEDAVMRCTRVVSNAKGYGPWLPNCRTWDNPNFDPNFVIEI